MRMTTPRLAMSLVLFAVGSLSAATASAEEVRGGEVWVKLVGNDYTVPYVDGDRYEDHEFQSPTLLVIRVDDYHIEQSFELRPSNTEFASVMITTVPKKFKATYVRSARQKRMVMKLTAKFTKAPPEPKPAPEKEKVEPAPKVEPKKPAPATEPEPAPATK